jgi:hypothetical protein
MLLLAQSNNRINNRSLQTTWSRLRLQFTHVYSLLLLLSCCCGNRFLKGWVLLDVLDDQLHNVGISSKNNRWSITNVIANSQNLCFFFAWLNLERQSKLWAYYIVEWPATKLQTALFFHHEWLERKDNELTIESWVEKKRGPTTLKSKIPIFCHTRITWWETGKTHPSNPWKFYEGQMITRLCVCCVATKTCPLIMCSLLPFVPVPQLRGQRWGFDGHGFQTVHPTRYIEFGFASS